MKCLSINTFIFNFPPVPPPFYLLGHTFKISLAAVCGAYKFYKFATCRMRHGTIKENVKVITRAMINFINRYAEGELSI